jgi:hypothetical protein
MYYIIESETGLILESSDSCPDPQDEANYYDCEIYIIQGEHSGLSAKPEREESKEMQQQIKTLRDFWLRG